MASNSMGSPISLEPPRYNSTPTIIGTKRTHQELDTVKPEFDADDMEM